MRPFAAVWLLLISTAVAASVQWTVHTDTGQLRDFDWDGEALWTAGRGGALRFDPVSGQTDFLNSGHGLPASDLSAVLAISPQEIWFGLSEEGLVKYEPDQDQPWTRYQTFPQGLAADAILCLEQGPDGRVWYGSEGGLGVMEDSGPGSIWTSLEGLGDEQILDLLFDADTLYVAAGDGVYRLNPDGSLQADEESPSAEVSALVMAADSLWLLSQGEIRGRAPSSDTWQTLALPAGDWIARALAATGDTLLAVLADPADPSDLTDTVWRYIPPLGDWEDISAGLPDDWYPHYHNPDWMTLAAVGGRIWLGADMYNGSCRGLVYYEEGSWQENDFDDRYLGQEVKALRFGPSGALWSVSTTGGARYLDGQWQRIYRYWGADDFGEQWGGMPYFGLDILEDSNGWVWHNRFSTAFGRQDGADGQRERILPGAGSCSSIRYLRMAEDEDGRRWFASDDAGLDVLDADGVWHNLSSSNEAGLPGDNVAAIAFIERGSMALLFRGSGLAIWRYGADPFDYDDDEWLTVGSGIVDSDGDLDGTSLFLSLAAGEGGRLWVGQADGLALLEPQGFAGYQVQSFVGKKSWSGDGLINPSIHDLASASDGKVWVGSEGGLSLAEYDGDADLWTVLNWTNEAGREAAGEDIFGQEVLSPLPHQWVQRVASRVGTDRVWVGTKAGVACLELLPEEVLPPNEALAAIYLYPNPARAALGHTDIFLGGADGPVDVTVFNLEGQVVARAGKVLRGEAAWPGLTTRFGSRAVSGIYRVRIEDRGEVALRTVVLER